MITEKLKNLYFFQIISKANLLSKTSSEAAHVNTTSGKYEHEYPALIKSVIF